MKLDIDPKTLQRAIDFLHAIEDDYGAGYVANELQATLDKAQTDQTADSIFHDGCGKAAP